MKRIGSVVVAIGLVVGCGESPLPVTPGRASVALQLPTTRVVDDDGLGAAGDCDAGAAAFSTIQAGVNAALPGDEIFICPGTYDEQIVVSTPDVVLRGAGAGATVIRPSSVAVNTNLGPTSPGAPILLVTGVSGVVITGVTVDGGLADAGAVNLPGCSGQRFYLGIFYRNSSGRIAATHLTNIRSATSCAVAAFARSDASGAAAVTMENNTADHYGVAGLICSGFHTTCDLIDNVVRGAGPVDDQLQFGISIRSGATATVVGNVITDHYFLPHRVPGPGGGIGARSAGMFIIFADPDVNPFLLRDNAFARNEMNIQRVATAEVID